MVRDRCAMLVLTAASKCWAVGVRHPMGWKRTSGCGESSDLDTLYDDAAPGYHRRRLNTPRQCRFRAVGRMATIMTT